MLFHVSFPLKLPITVGTFVTVAAVQLLGLEMYHQMPSQLPRPVPDLISFRTGKLLFGLIFLSYS